MESEDENDTTLGPAGDQQVKSMDWNFEADLDLLKARLYKSTETERGKVRLLIETSLSLTKNSELESDDGMNESVTEDVTSLKPVVCEKCPLRNYLILNRVLSYLPLKSLFNYRLVNSSWSDMALPWIQEKMNGRPAVAYPYFSKLCADFENAEVFPLTKLKLSLSDMSLANCSQFFPKHGTWIQDLYLCEDSGFAPSQHYPGLQEEWTKLENIFSQVPNLEKLAFDMKFIPQAFLDPIQIKEPGQQNVTWPQVNLLELGWKEIPLSKKFLDAFFRMLPNVKEFQFGYKNESPNQDWEVFVEALKKVGVQKLHLCSNATPDALWRAMTGSLALKGLSIDLNWNRHGQSKLQTSRELFLRSQADSLEDLNLVPFSYDSSPVYCHPDYIGLPVMKNLKAMSFLKNTKHPSHYSINSLHSEQFPKLQTLRAGSEVIQSIFAYTVFSSVEEVIVIPNKYAWEEDNCLLPNIKIEKTFPNLKKLTGLIVEMNANSMKSICTNLYNIEDLELQINRSREKQPPKDINLVLSGIPVGNTWALDLLAERVGYSVLPSWIDPPGASLLNLKRLRRLTLTLKCRGWKGEDRSHIIDDIGGYFTFLCLSPQLHLTLQGDFTISDDLARKLGGHFRIIYLKPKQRLKR